MATGGSAVTGGRHARADDHLGTESRGFTDRGPGNPDDPAARPGEPVARPGDRPTIVDKLRGGSHRDEPPR